MRRIISIALLSFYLITFVRSIYPYVDYFINQDYIASVLCEKKDELKNDCHGKCHLNKQIKKIQQEHPINKNTPSSRYQVENDQFFVHNDIFVNKPIVNRSKSFIFYSIKTIVKCQDVPNPPPQFFC